MSEWGDGLKLRGTRNDWGYWPRHRTVRQGDFQINDGIKATCDLCHASVFEPLQGRYDEARVRAAVDRASTWMAAHMETFHPFDKPVPQEPISQ